jgi:KDO2-lipid IV(A) lauroyltransferase
MASLLFNFLFRLLALMPLRMLHGLGALLGKLIYISSATYARRIREHLQLARLAGDAIRHRKILAATIVESGKSFSELAWIWGKPYQQVVDKVRQCHGFEHIASAQALGKGIIFLTPHLGCFEISSLYTAQRIPITVLYRQPKLSWLEAVMRKGRERGLVKLAKADVGGVRQLYKALKRGEAIGVLPDQVPSQGEGEWVAFFGRPAYTMTLIGRLVQSSGAAVIMCYSERLPKGEGYTLHFSPVLFDLSQPIPRQMNTVLEATVRACPEQYLWSYNRYKVPRGVSQPDGIKE